MQQNRRPYDVDAGFLLFCLKHSPKLYKIFILYNYMSIATKVLLYPQKKSARILQKCTLQAPMVVEPSNFNGLATLPHPRSNLAAALKTYIIFAKFKRLFF